MGPDGSYTIFNLENRNTGAAFTIRGETRGMPANWMLYVATDSADESAAKAAAAGGRVIKAAFDVMDFGRMAVVCDPTGACFGLWQAKQHIGTGITGVPGTLCWADLSTSDPEAAVPFYQAVFGWKIGASEKDDSGYLHIQNGQAFVGGVPPARYRNPQVPPHWLLYMYVADCDASSARVKELGGNVHMEPTTIEKVGRMAVVADPQSAVFSIF
jgi:hypothetical protein